MKLLLSVHDVTPAHRQRLERIEERLAAWKATRVTYLLVPDFHGRHPVRGDTGFAAWCCRTRPFAVSWALHGFLHSDRQGRGTSPLTAIEKLKARLLTGGEGEFIHLTTAEMRVRLASGDAVFEACLGTRPQTFVAPAWLFPPGLLPVLREAGVRFTEDHTHLYDLATGARLACPVMTWATRSRLHTVGSLAFSAAWRRLVRRHPIVRVAIHPHDVDHPQVMRDIGSLVQEVAASRAYADIADCFAPE